MAEGNALDATLFPPLVPAPRFGSLSQLQPGQKRFLGACDGLYVEARSAAMRLRLKVANAVLPFGPLAAQVELDAGPVPRALLREFVEQAHAQAEREVAAAIVLDGEGVYRLHWPEVEAASAGHIRYRDTLDDARLVFDLHSHASGPAFFSRTDDASDLSRPGPYFALVVGRCDEPDPEIVGRAVLPPYLQPLPLAWLIEHGVLA